jgi:hypothetical protein
MKKLKKRSEKNIFSATLEAYRHDCGSPAACGSAECQCFTELDRSGPRDIPRNTGKIPTGHIHTC